VIAVISSNAREASALSSLVSQGAHPTSTCTSLSQFRKLLRKVPPSVVLTRCNLTDGYSDDVLALLSKSRLLPGSAVIVLARADCTAREEARHLGLGADCVLRDPLRPEALVGYATKFLRASQPARSSQASTQFTLAGATIVPDFSQLKLGTKCAHLSPKEIELARLLAEAAGKTVSYDLLYSELFGRKFAGDSANARVLFGKLAASFRKIRINLRQTTVIVPKSGFRYSPA
jgi:DNA-binding response OmpR family regulator